MPAVTEIAIGLAEKAQRFLTNPGQVAAMGTFLVALMAWAVGVCALSSTEPGSMS